MCRFWVVIVCKALKDKSTSVRHEKGSFTADSNGVYCFVLLVAWVCVEKREHLNRI